MSSPKYVEKRFVTNPIQPIRAGKLGAPEPYTVGGVKASGSIQLSANPTSGDTIVLNGVTVTFGAAADVAVGVDLATTLNSLQAFLDGSADEGLSVATYTDDNTDTLTITFDAYGTEGNGYLIDVSDLTAAPTASDAALSGGQPIVGIDLNEGVHQFSVSQGVNQNFSLADGDESQRLVIYLSAKTGSGGAVVTPTNFADGTKMTFDTVGEFVELMFIAGKWRKLFASTGVVA